MTKGKKRLVLMAGGANAGVTLLIIYLTINDIIDEIVFLWLSCFNIVFIAVILVWCALDLENK